MSGPGIAVLPKFLVADKQPIPLLEGYQLPSFTVYAVYPSRQCIPAKVKVKVFLAYPGRLAEPV